MKLLNKIQVTILLGLVLMSTLAIGAVVQAAAQSVEDVWELPVNLSQSGAATDPVIIVDATGQRHALWLDTLDGVVYSRTDEAGWIAPQAITGPFSDGVPVLVVDESGVIHAFWQDEENILFYSRLVSGEFTNVEAWTTPVQLGVSTLTTEAVIDRGGRLHLTFIKNVALEEDDEVPIIEDPAGVYYRVSADGGATWSDAAPVYNSLYYRLLEEEDAHVQIAATLSSVFIVWDDNPNERVLSVRSPDGGQTWDGIRQVDGREELDDPDNASPSQIKVVANNETIYMQWQAQHGDSGCTIYYQWSRDGGLNWQPNQRVVEDIQVCGESSVLFFHNDLLFMLVSSVSDSYYLLAWDNGRWSQPEEQMDLLNFVDPDTFRPLSLDCLQGVLEGDQLYLVGCDQLGGGDVWLTSRRLADVSTLFPPPSIWRERQSVTTTDNVSILSPVSIADDRSRVHILWSQTQSNNAALGTIADDSIYYARWDGSAWLGPVAVATSPTGSAENPAVALGGDGHLLLVWSGTAGDIYFSQADVAQANAASTWAEPVRLPVSQAVVGQPDILVDRAGTIYVAYAISLNENRGVYITKSNDGGATWSDPATAFDGVAADWEMVESPQLAQTNNGNLYLLWSHYSLPPNQNPLGLYFARLVAGDEQWSEPELVAEGSVIWSELRGVGERVVHRIWQEVDSGNISIQHEYSLDNGLTWNEPVAFFPDFEESLGAISLISDSFNQLHLLQINNDTLSHWLWDSDRWVSQEPFALADLAFVRAESLTAAIDPALNLSVIYTARASETVDGVLQNTMFFSSRPMEMPQTAPPPLPSLTPTPLPTATATPTPGPSPTPTIRAFTEVSQDTGPLPSLFTEQPLILGIIPAGFLVLVVLFVGIRFRAVRGRGD